MILSSMNYSFIRSQAALSWREAQWGYSQRIIDWECVVDLAQDKLNSASEDSSVIELSSLYKTEAHRVEELLHTLANNELVQDICQAKKKWLFLVLAWIFENKDKITDPLSEVESVYADFDYPEELESFIRYMPPKDGYDSSNHSTEINEARLISNWSKYLNNEKEKNK